MPTNWSRRFKNHVEKLKSGDIYEVAEVVRNLSLRDQEKGLSAGEKSMLAQARQILVSELTFAIDGRPRKRPRPSSTRRSLAWRPTDGLGDRGGRRARAAASAATSRSST